MDPVQYHDNSVILLLSEQDAAFCRKLSRNMNLAFGDYLPHVTVVGVKRITADAVNHGLSTASPQEGDVFIEGVYFRLEQQRQRVWVGLTVRKSPWIVELRQRLCEALDLPADNEEYFAHITLGCLAEDQLGSVKLGPLAVEMTTRQLSPVKLAVAKNGGFGKVSGVVSEYENHQHYRAD